MKIFFFVALLLLLRSYRVESLPQRKKWLGRITIAVAILWFISVFLK